MSHHETVKAGIFASGMVDGGGSGGTTNYNALSNKPKINGTELKGNLTSEQIGLHDGAKGDPGEDGAAAAVAVGSVTSGEIPSVTNSGTSLNAVFDFVLPKGDKGEKGDTGTAGADGKNGKDGADGKDGRSFTIQAQFATLDELKAAHPAGTAGDAYIVGTVDENVVYSWSEELSDWLNLGPIRGLKGDKGDPGEDGSDGADGTNGEDGFTPTITAVSSDEGVTLTITNRTGTQNVTVRHGEKGDTGEAGFSPSASVEQLDDGAKITVTDKDGTTSAVVKNTAEGLDERIGELEAAVLGEKITLTAAENIQIDTQKCWKYGNLVILQMRVTTIGAIETPTSFMLATDAPIPTSIGGNHTRGIVSLGGSDLRSGVTWISNGETMFRAGFDSATVNSIPVGTVLVASITYTID